MQTPYGSMIRPRNRLHAFRNQKIVCLIKEIEADIFHFHHQIFYGQNNAVNLVSVKAVPC